MLDDFNTDGEIGRKVVLLASSHAGEESSSGGCAANIGQ